MRMMITINSKPTTKQMSEKLYISNNKAYRQFSSELVDGYEEVVAVSSPPPITWKGPLIPVSLIRQISSFLAWANKERGGEAQVRLYVNKAENRWLAWAFPQEERFMETKEIQCPEADDQRSALGRVIETGTVHSHCDAPAFQSGGDSKDEKDRPAGLHITVGNLASERYSVHARFGWLRGSTKAFHDVELSSWIEVPPEYRSLPPKIQSSIVEHLITQPSDEPFPEIWKDNVKKREQTNFYHNNLPSVYQGHHSNDLNGRTTKWLHDDWVGKSPAPTAPKLKKIHEVATVTALDGELQWICEQHGFDPTEALDLIPFMDDVLGLLDQRKILLDDIKFTLEEMVDAARALEDAEVEAAEEKTQIYGID